MLNSVAELKYQEKKIQENSEDWNHWMNTISTAIATKGKLIKNSSKS